MLHGAEENRVGVSEPRSAAQTSLLSPPTGFLSGAANLLLTEEQDLRKHGERALYNSKGPTLRDAATGRESIERQMAPNPPTRTVWGLIQDFDYSLQTPP